MIAIDWGTSSFRAFRLDEAGTILARRASPGGILRVPEGRFAETLLERVGDWLAAGERRVLLCGMVGSRQGWVEANYVACPVRLEDLVSALIEVPFDAAQVLLVPGVIGTDPSGVPEVMRGEETEAMGILDSLDTAAGIGTGLVCLPGTHSKWMRLENGTIDSFLTCMTGEVFAALRTGTILAQLMDHTAATDTTAFLRGVARSAEPGGLLHHLFSVRTLALTNQLAEEAAASFLSGLLIGHEVRAVMPPGAHVHLVGAPALCSLYAEAIAVCGSSFTLEDEDAAARGLAAIARRLAWN